MYQLSQRFCAPQCCNLALLFFELHENHLLTFISLYHITWSAYFYTISIQKQILWSSVSCLKGQQHKRKIILPTKTIQIKSVTITTGKM